MSDQSLTELQRKGPTLAASETRPVVATPSEKTLHPVLQLQRILGNRRGTQLIQMKQLTPDGTIIGLQRKLTVGAAGDQYEREADSVAGQVLNTSVPTDSMQRAVSPEEDKDQTLQTKPLAGSITRVVQRQMGELPHTKLLEVAVQRQEAQDEDEMVRAKSAGSLSESFETGDDFETQVSQSKGHGSPLPDSVRTYMEPRFGADFSHVKVHTGNNAVQMNRDVGAQAFTHGSDIYFGAGHSPTDLALTAHELTHVIQQTGGVPQTKEENSSGVDRSVQRVCAACSADDGHEKAPGS